MYWTDWWTFWLRSIISVLFLCVVKSSVCDNWHPSNWSTVLGFFVLPGNADARKLVVALIQQLASIAIEADQFSLHL